jgi:hypothetical protein
MDVSDRSPLTPSDGFSRVANANSGAVSTSGAMALYQAHAAGPPPSGRAARWLDRTLRVVDEGPRPFYRAAVLSLGVTSALAMGVAALIRPHDSLPATQWHVITAALAGLWLSAILGLGSLATAGRTRLTAWLDRTVWLDHLVAPRERAAIWLALAAWFPLLLVVVYYRARATIPPPVRYVYFPYDDKRWETAAYLLGVIAPVILLTTVARVLTVARGIPPTWRAWFTGLFPGTRS